MSGLRITIIGLNYSPEPTGIAPYTAGLARGLMRHGHEVSVLTSYPHYPQWSVFPGYLGLSMSELVDGVPVHRLRSYVPAKPHMLRRAVAEITFGARAVGAPWARPDVVVCISPALLSSAAVVMRARRTKAAVGLVMQDIYSTGLEQISGRSLASGALARLERSVARSADGVAVIHDRLRSRVVTDLGVPEANVTVVRNWTHVPLSVEVNRSTWRRTMGWAPDEIVVLHAGAQGEKQGLENVVAAGRIADGAGSKIRFVLMGDGSQRRSLTALARGVGSVAFLDPLSDGDFVRALAAADVLLVNERPGVTDMAVPSKLTSYFQSGRPVVAATTATSTTAAEVKAAGAGVVVAPGHPEVLLDAVARLAARPDEAEAMGANGRRYCREVLSETAALVAYDRWVRSLHTRSRTEVPPR